MSLLFPLALGFLIFYFNGRVAKTTGRNPILWGFISLVAYFVSYAILAGFYLGIMYKGAYTQDGMRKYIEANPLTGLLMLLFGFSGVLAVRFYLEKSSPREER